MITFDDVRAAARRIGDGAQHTPVVDARTLDDLAGATVFCKAECVQRTGSFKIRGAVNRTEMLSATARRHGAITYSSGNHAQALAQAGARAGVAVTVLMPSDAPPVKRQATEALGARVITYDRRREDREAMAAALARRHGLTVIPPFDDPAVIAGQATVALELFGDVGRLDVLVVPVGGGGLLAGCAIVAAARHAPVRVVAAEPAGRPLVRGSLDAGRRITVPPPTTLADGLRSTRLGRHTFAVLRRLVDDVVAVEEVAIVEAMRVLHEATGHTVEPSGAVALAAVLQRRVGGEGRRVGVVLSGGNIAPERHADLISRSRRAGDAGRS